MDERHDLHQLGWRGYATHGDASWRFLRVDAQRAFDEGIISKIECRLALGVPGCGANVEVDEAEPVEDEPEEPEEIDELLGRDHADVTEDLDNIFNDAVVVLEEHKRAKAQGKHISETHMEIEFTKEIQNAMANYNKFTFLRHIYGKKGVDV